MKTLKAIGSTYRTETFHSCLAFAKYVKICFVAEALNKEIRAVTWY